MASNVDEEAHSSMQDKEEESTSNTLMDDASRTPMLVTTLVNHDGIQQHGIQTEGKVVKEKDFTSKGKMQDETSKSDEDQDLNESADMLSIKEHEEVTPKDVVSSED